MQFRENNGLALAPMRFSLKNVLPLRINIEGDTIFVRIPRRWSLPLCTPPLGRCSGRIDESIHAGNRSADRASNRVSPASAADQCPASARANFRSQAPVVVHLQKGGPTVRVADEKAVTECLQQSIS